MPCLKKPIRVLAVLQARTSSSRLPAKVLADISGKPMILRQLARISRARMIDQIVLATSVDSSDDQLADVVRAAGVSVVRGSLDDVLDRFAVAARSVPTEHVVRLTGDCPLIDPNVIDAVVAHHLVGGVDITSNTAEPTFPDGLDVEVMRVAALFEAAEKASHNFEREHVTQYIYAPTSGFRVANYRGPKDLSAMRWTVDTSDDLEFVREVYAALIAETPEFVMQHVLQLLDLRPELSQLNAHSSRNEGLVTSLAEEAAPSTPGDK